MALLWLAALVPAASIAGEATYNQVRGIKGAGYPNHLEQGAASLAVGLPFCYFPDRR